MHSAMILTDKVPKLYFIYQKVLVYVIYCCGIKIIHVCHLFPLYKYMK